MVNFDGTVPMRRTETCGFPFREVMVPVQCPHCGRQETHQMQVSAIDDLEGQLLESCSNCSRLYRVILIEVTPVMFSVECYPPEDTQSNFLLWAGI